MILIQIWKSFVSKNTLHNLSLIIPKLKQFQSPGFAIIIDRRSEGWQWQDIQAAFSKIVAVFPGKIKEVFLLYKYPEGTFPQYR